MSDEVLQKIERFLKKLENEKLSAKLQSERHTLLKEVVAFIGEYYHSEYVVTPPSKGNNINYKLYCK
jgi:alpha-mannosidase